MDLRDRLRSKFNWISRFVLSRTGGACWRLVSIVQRSRELSDEFHKLFGIQLRCRGFAEILPIVGLILIVHSWGTSIQVECKMRFLSVQAEFQMQKPCFFRCLRGLSFLIAQDNFPPMGNFALPTRTA